QGAHARRRTWAQAVPPHQPTSPATTVSRSRSSNPTAGSRQPWYGDGDQSGLGVALAGTLLRDVDAAVDLLAVAAAGALVRDVASLLKPLVDLLVVLVGEVLGLVHEATHTCLLVTGERS